MDCGSIEYAWVGEGNPVLVASDDALGGRVISAIAPPGLSSLRHPTGTDHRLRTLGNPSIGKDDRVNQMNPSPASSITKSASKQTYYTIRFLVDRERVDDAYRAYGYFRWVDDILDADSGSG